MDNACVVLHPVNLRPKPDAPSDANRATLHEGMRLLGPDYGPVTKDTVDFDGRLFVVEESPDVTKQGVRHYSLRLDTPP